jgi:hypothetical protein
LKGSINPSISNLDQDSAEFFLQALDEPALVRLETALAALPIDTPWLYATPIVHASLPAGQPRRRRVLQVDYSADVLPHPLAWRGI